ncbi:unnamed protein product [Ectocarpus sp. 6 AP-2014]
METRGMRAKEKQHNKSKRAGLRSSPRRCAREARNNKPGGCDADLPHHVVLEIVSFLDTRSIVSGRCLSRAFSSDARALVKTLDFHMGQQSPSAETIKLFPEVRQVNLDGNRDLVHAVVAGLRGWGSSLRLDVSLHDSVPQKEEPLSKTATTDLCALPLTELDMMEVVVEFPPLLPMNAWRTLQRLVIRDAFLGDESLESLSKSIPEGALPLRHLDLSRNLFGGYDAVLPFADALRSCPDLEWLELSACRICRGSGDRIVRTLLEGACPKLRTLDLSLNFFTNGLLASLCEGLGAPGHGLLNLRKLGFGSRVTGDEMITCFEKVGKALAAGGLPKLDFLHLQGDVGPRQVSPVLSRLKGGACPMLAMVKLERSLRSTLGEDEFGAEDAAQSMFNLVVSGHIPHLREVHALGMALNEGMEKANEAGRDSAFYRARNQSTWHHLAVEGKARGVQVFV